MNYAFQIHGHEILDNVYVPILLESCVCVILVDFSDQCKDV